MIALSLPLKRIIDWDLALCRYCNRQSLQSAWVRDSFRVISRLGDGVFWYSLMAALLLVYRAQAIPAVCQMLLTATVGVLFYKLIKHKTLRPRPCDVYPSIVCTGRALDQFSFPSGHTLHAVAFSTIALAHFPAWSWLLLPFTLLVALSRPILGLHYPSDVLAGGVLGATLAHSALAWMPAL